MTKKTIFITGASSGIGLASALRLSSDGFHVIAGVLPGEDITPLSNHASISTIPIDITKADMVLKATESIKQAVSDAGLYGLFNNAGIAISGPIEAVPIEALRQQLEVNLIGHIRVTQHLLPLIRPARGRIVNTVSILGRVAVPFSGPYSISKFAMEAFTDILRMELKQFGVHVCAIEPGTIATPLWQKTLEHTDALASELSPYLNELYSAGFESFADTVKNQQGRGISPDEVAQKVSHAFTAARPRTRYVIGGDAQTVSLLRQILPDRVLDWALNRLYPITKR